jgi:hypothetical protein
MTSTSTLYVPTWYLFIETFNDLKRQRNTIEDYNEFKIAAINSSMILHLAGIVEGSINSLLTDKVESNSKYKKAKQEDDEVLIRIFELLLVEIQKSSWGDISKNLSGMILGYRLNEAYKDDWESIRYLFEFRNLLVHGGSIVQRTKTISKAKTPIELSEMDKEKEETLTKKELFQFLTIKNLIDSVDNNSFISWKMINSKTVDYFLNHAKEFLNKVYDLYSNSNSINSLIEMDIITADTK